MTTRFSEWSSLFCFFNYRFVAISDLYEPTDDGTDSQVRDFFLSSFSNANRNWKALNSSHLVCASLVRVPLIIEGEKEANLLMFALSFNVKESF